MTEVSLLVSGRSGGGGQHSLKYFLFFKAMSNEVVTQTKLKQTHLQRNNSNKTDITLTITETQTQWESHAHRQKEGHDDTGQGRTGWDMQPDVLHKYTQEYISIHLTHEKLHIELLTGLVSVLNSHWSDCHRINVPQQNSMGTGQDSEHVGQRWKMSMSRPEDI